MQQNGQEQQESRRLSQAVELTKGEASSEPTLVQEEQHPTTDRQKAEEYLDLLQRTQADFINYRRRMNQEQAEGRLAAQIELLFHLLPVLDDLGRALGSAPSELAPHPWVQGLFLIERRLLAQFDQLGVQPFGRPGEPFDPRRHEAINPEPRVDVPEGTILYVARLGYTLRERVIRPAQVSVASAPARF